MKLYRVSSLRLFLEVLSCLGEKWNTHCEDLWLEVHCKNSNFILGVIYRHPNQNFSLFQDTLHNQLYDFESNKLNYVVGGDININTSAKNTKITEYIEKLNSIGCKQLVDAPTRFASTVNCNSSLLDHVYTNMLKKTLSGVSLFELSDHLPTFFIIPNTKSHLTNKLKYKRCRKNFDLEDFLIDLQENVSKIDFKSTNTSVNNDVYSLTSIFKSILDKHAPLIPVSGREKKLSDKPWITKGIIQLVLPNKLNRQPLSLKINDMISTEPSVIANELNEFFCIVGPTLADKIDEITSCSSEHFFDNSLSDSIFLEPPKLTKVFDGIMSLKDKAVPVSHDNFSAFFLKAVRHEITLFFNSY